MRHQKLFLAIALFALPIGCQNSDEIPELYPDRAGTFTTWKQIYWIPAAGTDREPRFAGFLGHEFSDSDPQGRHYVYDENRERLGFLTPSGGAYRYAESASGHLTTEDLGQRPRDEAILLLVGARGTLELRDVALPPSE